MVTKLRQSNLGSPFEVLQLSGTCLPELMPHLGHLDVHDPGNGNHSRRPLQAPVLQVLRAVSVPSPWRLDLGGSHLATVGAHESSPLKFKCVCVCQKNMMVVFVWNWSSFMSWSSDWWLWPMSGERVSIWPALMVVFLSVKNEGWEEIHMIYASQK